MDPTDPLASTLPRPTSRRPLLGLTVLVVEDSRYACEAIRLMCLRSGARIRRADCLRSARRHLQVYRPTVVIVDVGLPDGSGLDLMRELAEAQSGIEALMAMSGDAEMEALSLQAGAQGFFAKPISSLARFQEAILASLPPARRPVGPRVVSSEAIEPDIMAFQDDIAHIADVLEDPPDEHALDYVAQFLRGVAQSADDPTLAQAADALAQKRSRGEPAGSETAAIAGLIQARLAQRIAI
ncbi:MAG: response regulator [Pseudomonadota bacterium]